MNTLLNKGGTAERRVTELLEEQNGKLPVWIRCPARGHEHFTGFSRSKLYELSSKGLIKSVSIREVGQTRGTRLFSLGSILGYINQQVAQSPAQ